MFLVFLPAEHELTVSNSTKMKNGQNMCVPHIENSGVLEIPTGGAEWLSHSLWFSLWCSLWPSLWCSLMTNSWPSDAIAEG